MKFSVATNWRKDLLDSLQKYPEVEDVFGKLDIDLVGGGRASYLLPKIDQEKAREYIQEAHKRGIQFTYLLNASCLNNKEFSLEWRYRFGELLDWLVDIGVDRVTVAIPYMIEIIKERYPDLKINVSSFATVNSMERAKRFERLGVDEITFDYMCVQRDFKLMEQMVKNVNCRFQLLVNNVCLYQCSDRFYHANLSSHASQIDHECKGFVTEYCVLSCVYEKITNPVELIKSNWVRPEDLGEYENLGIEKIKIVDRIRTTDWLARVVDSYAKRRFSGNLLDILNVPGSAKLQQVDLDGVIQADTADRKLMEVLGTLSAHQLFYIDNQALDGFLEFFKTTILLHFLID